MKIRDIKINGIKNPVGFQLDHPTLSFKVDDTESKKAKNISVTVWKKEGFQKVFQKIGTDIAQKGLTLDFELEPRTIYQCMISVEGDLGDQAEEEFTFETGKMQEAWEADWITPAGQDGDGRMHPVMSKEIEILKPIRSARLYVTGVGTFEAYMNEKKIGSEILAPFLSHYETYIQVLTLPVENMVLGKNRWDFLLGKGWYMGQFGLEGGINNYGDRMAVIGELHIAYEDGSSEVFLTDGDFNYTASDIVDSGIYFGEVIDRTRGNRIADLTNVPNHSTWKKVKVISKPEAAEGTKHLIKEHLQDRISPALTLHETMPVKEIIKTPAGETVLDFGQNFAGLIRFTADFEPDVQVKFEFGEILQEGNFYHGNYREALSEFVYTSDGKKEVVEPHFTYFGFRYVKVTGWPGEIGKEDVVGRALYSDMDQTGFLHTGNDKIDQLISNTMWGLKSNFTDLPTDCPQRNERLGWTGDAQVFSPTASYHMDTRAFYHKFNRDLRAEQVMLDGMVPNYIPNIGHKKDCGSVWGDVATFVPDVLYRMFGDDRQLAENYPMMKDWVDYIDGMDQARGARHLYDFGFQFGDWLALDGVSESSFKGSTEDAYIGSMYFARSAELVANAAAALGRSEDEEHYRKLYEQIKTAILNEYFTPNGRLAADTQASYVVALKFGIYRDKDVILQQFKNRLKKDGYKIRCGFVGAPLLCTVLGECGEIKTAFDFLLNEKYPGWLYCVNMGATTVWERWNSVLEDGTISPTGMNSLNHYSYGSVMEFMYAYAAGIRPVTEGFEEAVIAPHPDARLPRLDCSYDSVSGRYVCNTQILEDGRLQIHIEIPFGAQARVELPESGKEAEVLGAGRYDFTYKPVHDYRRIYGEESRMDDLAENQEAMGILFQHLPAFGGIAMDHNPEFACNSLKEMKALGFIPFDPSEYDVAVEKLEGLLLKV